MDFEQFRQSVIDEEQLRLLPLFYWVSGGVTGLISLYFLIYVALGVGIATMPTSAGAAAASSPAGVGWVFAAIGGVGFAILAALATLKIMCGFWLRRRKHRVLVMLVAAVSCLEVPYGTLLGVFTFITLGRPSVAALFGAPPSAQDTLQLERSETGASDA
jgi:hypothetical protein